jgi:ABC-type Fe3+-hydroxamate transport system substrate-binding protein
MPSFTDQTGNTIQLDELPRRIISLVPSQTELLSDLGLDTEVIGITKFCIHPAKWFHSKTRVGGTKQIKTDIIHQLQPDLIIANKEENLKEQVEELCRHYPVWISDIASLEEAYTMMREIGAMTGKEQAAYSLIDRIKTNFAELTLSKESQQTSSAAYFIWQKPYMIAGGDTFINTMLQAAGLSNIFSNKMRYPEITIEDLLTADCEVLLLSSEPFPFKQKHVDELQSLLPHTKILLVDGELFSWYGSRLLKAPEYFKELHIKCQATRTR